MCCLLVAVFVLGGCTQDQKNEVVEDIKTAGKIADALAPVAANIIKDVDPESSVGDTADAVAGKIHKVNGELQSITFTVKTKKKAQPGTTTAAPVPTPAAP
jgi:hypothetical protein